jgi:hypothetical protein
MTKSDSEDSMMSYHADDDMNNIDSASESESLKKQTEKKNQFSPSNFPITETDMKAELLANTEKMKPEKDRVPVYTKRPFNESNNALNIGGNKTDYDHTENEHDDDNIDDYIDKDKNNDSHTENNSEESKQNPPLKSFNINPNQSASKPSNTHNDDSEEDGPHNKEDRMLKQLDMLRKLGELTQHGVKLSQNYNMYSDYNTMKYEYELHKNIRSKQNSVKMMTNVLLIACNGLEMLNDKHNPFDIKLEGWSDQINDDSTDYYEVFSELYEKYNKPGKGVAPELKLLFMISGSAVKFHLTNKFASQIPKLGDVLKNNPGLSEKIDHPKPSHNADFQKKMEEEHLAAAQSAADIHFLKQQEQEYLQKLANLTPKQYAPPQQYLAPQQIQQQSQQPIITNQQMQNMRNNVSSEQFESIRQRDIMEQHQRLQQQETLKAQYAQQVQEQQQSQYNQQVLANLNPEQLALLQQRNAAKQMQQQKPSNMNNRTNYSDSKSIIHVNPNLDNILNKKIDKQSKSKYSSRNSRDNDDYLTPVDTVDADEASRSNISIKRRARKHRSSGISLDV